MTSTTVQPTDASAVTTATAPPRMRTEAPGPTSRALSSSIRKQLRRVLATVVVVVGSIIALPVTAQAYPAPIRPDAGPAPISPDVAPASHASSSGWGLTTALGVVVLAALVVGLAVVAQRVARRRRAPQPTALDA